MPEYRLKTRIQNKYKTLAEWDAIAEGTFTPLFGEVCYAVENGMLLQKIGDGTTDFTKLEWLFCQAPQADQNENDINSPVYIKNRLAYTYQRDIPEDEQSLGYFDEWVEGNSQFDWEVVSLEEAQINNPLDVGLPETTTSILQGMARYMFLFKDLDDPVSFIKDNNNKIEAVLNSGVNTIKSFEFDINNVTSGRIEDADQPMTITAFLSGNPIGANIFLNMMMDGDVPSLASFDTSNYTEFVDYILLLLISVPDDKTIPPYASIAFIGDADAYVSQTPDPSAVTFDLNLLAQMDVYPIEEKYLSNVKNMTGQADQFEMDKSKPSYIKNRYGDLCQYRGWELNEENDSIFTGTYTISKRNETNIKITNGVYTNNLPVQGHGTAQLYYDVISYDVEINGVLYKNCPLTRTSNLMFKGNTLYFIGNPYLISSSAMALEGLAAEMPSPDYAKVCHLEDNGLPFLLIVEDLNSAKFLDDFIYGTPEWLASLTEDTINIKIGEAMMSAVTHMIPPHLLPADLSFTHWLFDRKTNSIAAKSAYSASGVNAFAIGTGTKATNANCVALGDGTQATGLRAFAGGYKSVASGQNAFAFGNTTTAAGFNTTAFGSGTVAQTASQLVIGKYNILDTVSKESNAFIIGNGTSDLRSNALTVDWNGNLKAAGSVETTSVILSSPNGTKFKVTVDDDGILTSTEITE